MFEQFLQLLSNLFKKPTPVVSIPVVQVQSVEVSMNITDPTFLRAQTFTRKEEGGWYAGDKEGDPNPTNFGIIQKTYDAYRTKKGLPLQSVKFISDTETKEIYIQFWQDAFCGTISAYCGDLAIIHFDNFFNTDPKDAFKILQHAVGAPEDGQCGPQTLALMKAKVASDKDGTIVTYMAARYAFLKSLHNWNSWGHIWTNRLNALAEYVGTTWRAQ